MKKQTNNQWLIMNEKIIKQVVRQCTEYSMKGNYGGNLPLEHIIRIFNGSTVEINKLQAEVGKLQSEVEQLKIKINTLKLMPLVKQ